jgi:hypothetical protein
MGNVKVKNCTIWVGFVLTNLRGYFCDWKDPSSGDIFRIDREHTIANMTTGKIVKDPIEGYQAITMKTSKKTSVCLSAGEMLQQVYTEMDIVNVPTDMRGDGALIGYPGYIFTTFGSVWNVRMKRWVHGGTTNDRVHYTITCVKAWRFMLAKALAQLFIPNPHNYSYVGFVDGDTMNLNVENLVWVKTRKETNRPPYVRHKMSDEAFYKSRAIVGLTNFIKFKKQFDDYSAVVGRATRNPRKKK